MVSTPHINDRSLKLPLRGILLFNGIFSAAILRRSGGTVGTVGTIFLVLSAAFNSWILAAHYWPKRIKLPEVEDDDDPDKKPKPRFRIIHLLDVTFVVVFALIVPFQFIEKDYYSQDCLTIGAIGCTLQMIFHLLFALHEFYTFIRAVYHRLTGSSSSSAAVPVCSVCHAHMHAGGAFPPQTIQSTPAHQHGNESHMGGFIRYTDERVPNQHSDHSSAPLMQDSDRKVSSSSWQFTGEA